MHGNFFIYLGVQGILSPNWNYPVFRENNGMSIQEINNIDYDLDVLFLSTSHMEFGFSPLQLYEENGLISYNAATSAQSIESSLYILQTLFDKGYYPRLILYDVGGLFFDSSDSYPYRYVVDNVNLAGIKQI